MGDEDVRHRLAAHGIEQCRRMGLVVGTGIDDRDLAAAYDVADRAGEGERARIVAENPPHAGTNLVDDTGAKRKATIERDVVVVGHGIPVGVIWRDARTSTAVIPRESGGSSNRRRSRYKRAALEYGIVRLRGR